MRALVVARAGLHGLLVERAVQWGERLGAGTSVHASSEEAAAAAAPGGVTVVVWADTPRLGEVHAQGVRSDLEAGMELVVAPALDGSVYLVAMSDARPALIGPGFQRVLELAAELSLKTGMLRHERRLSSPEDARALIADPLLGDDLVAAIRSG